jgi:hypothetical protein
MTNSIVNSVCVRQQNNMIECGVCMLMTLVTSIVPGNKHKFISYEDLIFTVCRMYTLISNQTIKTVTNVFTDIVDIIISWA